MKPAPATFGWEAIAAALAGSQLADAPVAVIVTTVDGTVAFWNAAAAGIYGWPGDEVVGRNVMEVTPAVQARREARKIMQRLQAGAVWEGEIVLRRRDGTAFTAFVADIPVGDLKVGGGAIVGVSAPTADRALVQAHRDAIAAEARARLA